MLAPADLLSLLPRRPATYAVIGPEGEWPAVLGAWGASPADQTSAELVVVTSGRADADADVVLDITGRRRRAGTGRAVERYALRRVDDRTTELRPGRWGRRRVTVDARGTATPAVVGAAGRGPCTSVRIGADPRRRVAIFTADAVIKVPRELHDTERGSAEQDVLVELATAGIDHVPSPYGAGRAAGLSWSAEARSDGAPLDGVRDPHRARSVLDAVATWLASVGGRTRRPVRPDELPLRGPYVAAALPATMVIDAVLQHGDLASGTNLLVAADGDFTVIDWETARRAGTPLVDLVPLLCLGVARARGARGAEAEAEVALALCRGDDSESDWLFAHVRRCAEASGVPADAVGPLAALAWGYQASMRLVHEELVLAAGGRPPAWTSPAELVARAWDGDPRLGRTWTAAAGA